MQNMAALPESSRPYLLATAAVAAAVAALIALQSHANVTTAALALVLVVTACAVKWGSGPALLGAVWAMLCLNYFFIPPIHTWVIAEAQNWIAFSVFIVTALTVGQLSSRAKRKAEEAEARRSEIERLYEQLRKAFEEASEAETLRKSEKLKAALLDAVTHDLRTPLTSIKASATTLLGAISRGHLGPALTADGQRELLEVIDEESDRLNRFVEEMMELAQIEGGQLLIKRSATPALDIINTALDRAAMLLQQHPVEVTIEDKLPLLHVDAASISGVVFELLENAVKYSPPGTPIHITASRQSPDAAQLAVEDAGAGIPPQLRERVFEKFFRASQQHREKQGFGMGLAIARGIIEAHGGQIRAEAGNDGRGTIICFTVPCKV